MRATARALWIDAGHDLLTLASGRGRRLRRAATGWPRRRVLALGTEREEGPSLLGEAFAELRRSHHQVELAGTSTGGRGKWENVSRLLDEHPAAGHDWLLVLDDDVSLPPGFLDCFVFLAERFELRIAQPAHRARSHAAWQVTRRRRGSVARQTLYVESGPVVGFHASTFETLLPFPPLRAGWGLDAHWAALAREHGWRIGVIDALGISHHLRRIAAAYDRQAAIEEATQFLAGRPYVTSGEAQQTLVTHRSWRS